jgi:Family of unknown function (DUF6402)
MSRMYKPGSQSHHYHRLSRTKRAAIAREVDRRFREQTGVARGLNPTSAKDLELRRTWLRIRDAVMEELEIEEDMDLHRELLLGGDFPREIAEEMYLNGWKEGGELLETWGERPPAIAPKYSAPVTSVIKMDWVLQFARAKSVYEKIMKERIWTNPKSQGRMAEILKQKPRVGGQPFGDLSRPVTVVDEEWINARPVESGLAFDSLAVALGAFELQVAIAGKLLSIGGGEFQVSIEEVGIYVKDSFDFNGSQFLGFWGYRDDPINNADFRQWRAENHAGGDFRVFSDVKRTRLTPADLVKGRL